MQDAKPPCGWRSAPPNANAAKKPAPNARANSRRSFARQYEAAASLPTAKFRKNTLEVRLNAPRLATGENVEVEAAFLKPTEAEKKPVQIPIERIEVAFTVINAVTALTAFIGAGLGWNPALIFGLYFVSYVTGGWFGLMASIEALKEKTLNVDLLMILAALGAPAIGQPAEGATLLFLFSLSNTLQTYAMDRGRKAIEKLLDLRPKQATVRRGSRLISLPIEQLTLGDVVLVRPGERFPIDGEVISGASDVNQATITGESMPVHKQANDLVFAGTVNGTGSLRDPRDAPRQRHHAGAHREDGGRSAVHESQHPANARYL
ncbi:MAG: hypothetical protein HND47_22370 [Chloroflexi bacterium]|nr:hypothetical protein [Chloroflexota bacterium]